MINESSLQTIETAVFSNDPLFRSPRYQDYSFSKLPGAVRSLYTEDPALGGLPADILGGFAGPYARIILLLLDSVGWSLCAESLARGSSLTRLVECGRLSKLTSQFPSTTAAHITCIHTGKPSLESGLYEWNIYEPSVDRIICPLPFCLSGDKAPGTLRQFDARMEQIVPQGTIYEELKSSGVTSTVYQKREIAFSPYSLAVTRGATMVGFQSFREGMRKLIERSSREKEPSYHMLYHDKVDALQHQFGPAAKEVATEVDSIFATIEELLLQGEGLRDRTLMMITADHGQIAVDPKTTRYLNRECPEIIPLLRTNREGTVLVPAGSPRDMFLHVAPENRAEVQDILQRKLEGCAEIYATTELLKRGLFGIGEPSERFRERVGDIVILPRLGETVWWYEENKFEQRFFGHHGGLTPGELEIPLLVIELP